jgi:hypothetical protein
MNGIRIAFWSTAIGIVSVATALAAGPPSHPNRPEPRVEYSADSYMETEQMTMKSKVYHAAGKERREQEMGGEQSVTIMRQDKQLLWTVMPSQQMYMEMSLQGKQRPPGDDPSNYTYERTEVGPDVIDGHQTTKYKVIATNSKGEKLGGFMWITREGIQIKMDLIALVEGSKTRMKTGLTNLKIERQDPALFEVPAGYTKMTMPGFGGMGGPAGATGRLPQTPATQRPVQPNLPTQEEVTEQATEETESASDAVKKGMEEEGISRFKSLFGR